MEKAIATKFSGYQKFVVAVLAFLQFTIILDFMILSPLGAILLPALKITTAEFGTVVSAYAFSAGIAGVLAAGFADRFDRKRLLMWFYAGFLLGTLFCALAPTYPFLLLARIVTGIFGGVIGSTVFAIITDLFPYEMRGRVMGIVQTAFAASQVLGIPAGLFLANHWGWHSPFFFIVGLGIPAGLILHIYFRPVDAHLKNRVDKNVFHHLWETCSNARYLQAFATTALLATGGFMIMPFASAFTVHNLGVSLEKLPWVYLITGVFSIVLGPVIGRASDSIGKFKVFTFGTVVSIVMVLIYTHLGPTPLFGVVAVNAILFTGIFSRMIPSQAIMSAVPAPKSRGSFMSISAAIQQVAGGFGAILSGHIVVQTASGAIQHFDRVGYVVVAASLFTFFMMYLIAKEVAPEQKGSEPPLAKAS